MTSDDTLSNGSQDSPSTIVVNKEPFLHFDENTELSFEDKSTIYNSLIALVEAEYPFDDALQDKALRFLGGLEPWGNQEHVLKLVNDLVPSSARQRSGFVDSILILLSSPHSNVVEAALSFLHNATTGSSQTIRSRLVESDLIMKVLAAVQPHHLPISGNEEIINNFIWTVIFCLNLASPASLRMLGVTTAVEQYDRREMIFRKVVIPSSEFMSFLISNRHILKGELLYSFMPLLVKFIEIGPFHRPTLQFVIASPIVMAFSSCLSIVEDNGCHFDTLTNTKPLLREWKKEGPEVAQSAKRMMQAMFSEGIENTLEQMIKNKSKKFGKEIVEDCLKLSQLLGSNVGRPQ
ncbi:hypothetical protein BLNAU_2035 [Blattamonas nauphoetae]|uniref:Uncharacterized protein n=1 Tax=Blattamonas nauphoetae TaxID=2049346 RepID=A0ABQ9YGY3_9EUKA|nr:hypothetical protein BLNAU_2035 [Blattamonas nauphoetae]